LSEELSELSFGVDLEDSSLGSILSMVGNSIGCEPVTNGCAEVSSSIVASGEEDLEIDRTVFADAVLVKREGLLSNEMPIVGLTVGLDAKAVLCE
jgi:hypothetical protein